MNIVDELFKTNSIKFIVSVDDCYGSIEETVEMSELIDEILERTDSYLPIIGAIGKYKFNLVDFIELPDEIKRKMITEWLDVLDREDIVKLAINPDSQELLTQKRTLLTFFDDLKTKEIITDFKTFDSIEVAKEFLEKGISGLWDPNEEKKVLWLIDRDFGEKGAENKGFSLLKEFHSEECKWNIAILATQKTEDIEQEVQFNDFLNRVSDLSESKNMFWKINKDFIDTNSNEEFANAISFGLKRNYTFRVTNFMIDALKEGIELAGNEFKNIEQSTFNNIVLNFSNDEGVSIVDTLTRVLLVLTKYDLNEKITQKYEDLVKLIHNYENLSTRSQGDNKIQNLSEVNRIRNLEKYNSWVNNHYYPVGFGDIFSINSEEYLLISQPCDITLRAKGDRKIKNGLLLRLTNVKPKHENFVFLNYFKKGEQYYVNLKDEFQIDLDILDLCALNADGAAKIVLNGEGNFEINEDYRYSKGLRNRLYEVLERLKQVYDNRISLTRTLDKLTENGDESVAGIIAEYKVKEQEMWGKFVTINNFHQEKDYIYYNVQRINRLNEFVTNSISFEHFTVSSRIGLPGDYAKQYKLTKYNLNVNNPSEFFGEEHAPPLLLATDDFSAQQIEDTLEIKKIILEAIKQVAPAVQKEQILFKKEGNTIIVDSSALPIKIKDSEYNCVIKADSLKIPTEIIALKAVKFMELLHSQSLMLTSNPLFRKFYNNEAMKRSKIVVINESITFKKEDFITGNYSFDYDGTRLLTINASLNKVADFDFELVMDFIEEVDGIESVASTHK
ncbi:hypothetical protein [Paenibacillus luteus]|uniref:hypothetical protein n=1 Tax=Paenibacillus luteus TaxID=2545753 RepID=UPI001141E816|nr:hypothetical protein [Paenibacillus luteus]